jgi:hypothetical protein
MPVPERVLPVGRPSELSAVVRVQPLDELVVTEGSAHNSATPVSRNINVVRKMDVTRNNVVLSSHLPACRGSRK